MRRSYHDFGYFLHNIFSQSIDILKDGEFCGGDYVTEIANWYQGNKRTIRVSARDHMKSMSFYAHIMWRIFRLMGQKKSIEANYFSYKESMAKYHLTKVKKAIDCNPFFAELTDEKKTAESIISYTWDGKYRFTLHPRGLLEFKRGIHCPLVYIDDPLQDPENKLEPTTIKKINHIMKAQVMDMVQDEIHVVGTAQTSFDFYFDKEFTHRFAVRVDPAIKDKEKKIVLWPEWMDYEELMAKEKERTTRIFNQEYLCSPSYTEDAFIHIDRVRERINHDLKNHTLHSWRMVMDRRRAEGKDDRNEIVAGWDLGKKNHPAHFVIFEKRGNKRVQLLGKWFDQVDYTEQLEFIEEACDVFEIDNLYYDGTRGELELLEESNGLPACFNSVTFSVKKKHSMATELDRAVEQKKIEFINDPRQASQIAIVNADLKAPETPEGHGDSFWSIGLTFMDVENDSVGISIL